MLMDTVSNKSCQRIFIKTVGSFSNGPRSSLGSTRWTQYSLKKKWQVLSATQLGACDSPATDSSIGNHSHNSYHLLMPVVCRRLCSGFHIYSPWSWKCPFRFLPFNRCDNPEKWRDLPKIVAHPLLSAATCVRLFIVLSCFQAFALLVTFVWSSLSLPLYTVLAILSFTSQPSSLLSHLVIALPCHPVLEHPLCFKIKSTLHMADQARLERPFLATSNKSSLPSLSILYLISYFTFLRRLSVTWHYTFVYFIAFLPD